MAQTHLRCTAEIREEQLRQGPEFRVHWERTALARALALAVIGYGVKHHLTQSQLAAKLEVRQPQVARSEMGEYTPSLEMLQRLARRPGLRFTVEVAPRWQRGPGERRDAPPCVEVEDVTADGSRILVATG
jgi:DNA-binding XRE family transcriptional regulator